MGTDGTRELAVLDKCRMELESISDLHSIIEIRDKAKAIASYQKARDGGHAASNRAKMIVALAEARAGQVLSTIPRSPGASSQVATTFESECQSMGIGKSEAYRFQDAARVLDAEPGWFDAYREQCDDKHQDFTQHAVIRKGRSLRNDATKGSNPSTPKGKYDVIVIDPPWPMEMYERDDRPNQAKPLAYPTMTEAELSELKIPAADSCHLWLWTTHRFLPMAIRLLPTWDFKYVCSFVWHKDNSIQPIGLPKYNCEFALYARRGTPKFADLKNFWCCFNAPRGAHSEKPQEFYDVVRRVTTGKRLDMFNRRRITGFVGWGNESR